MNIVDPIVFHAKLNPDAMAICVPGAARESVAYGELVRMMNNVGRMALSLGLMRGDTVAILVADKIFHAAMILGLAHVGIVTVSARTPKLPKELGVQAVITDAPARFENVGRVIVADMLWTMGDGKPLADHRAYRAADDDLCRIILTSGTTGEAKGVAFTHANLRERLARYEYVRGGRFPLSARLFCGLGITTSLTFIYMLRMLSRGATIFLYGDSPESTLQSFGLYQVQNMVAAPATLAEFLKIYEMQPAFQCGFDHVMSAGGYLSPAFSARLRARMGANLFCGYGATETGEAAFGPAQIVANIPGAVGYLVPGASIEAVDDAGNVLAPGKGGIVRVRTAHTVSGYVGAPKETEQAFRDGWFYPGDIGYLTEDRMLVILGRDKSVLNVGGDKVRPELVEEAIKSFASIQDAAVFSVADELGIAKLWAAIVTPAAVDESALRSHCTQQLGGAFVPTRFVQVRALPRNDMGKVERDRLPELVRTHLN
jgi:acyl-CoA synthetase (AMP-forming)/AMP-acid ligase II